MKKFSREYVRMIIHVNIQTKSFELYLDKNEGVDIVG
jgi:hypothetical protein